MGCNPTGHCEPGLVQAGVWPAARGQTRQPAFAGSHPIDFVGDEVTRLIILTPNSKFRIPNLK